MLDYLITILLQIFSIRLRNLWLPLFLNCWLAKSALDAMLVSILTDCKNDLYLRGK